MERRHFDWTPSWEDRVIQGWVRNYTRKNLWRVAPFYDYDDLIQEFGYIFAYCVRLYPRVVDAPHFMQLFKISCVNWLHDLSRQKMNKAKFVFSPTGEGLEGEALDILEEVAAADIRADLDFLIDAKEISSKEVYKVVSRILHPKEPKKAKMAPPRKRLESPLEFLNRIAKTKTFDSELETKVREFVEQISFA